MINWRKFFSGILKPDRKYAGRLFELLLQTQWTIYITKTSLDNTAEKENRDTVEGLSKIGDHFSQ